MRKKRKRNKYLILFERVATTLKWPKDVWTLLLQCVAKCRRFTERCLLKNSLQYEQVKAGILRAYEVVPEDYRQNFGAIKSKSLDHMSSLLTRKRNYLIDGAQRKGLKLWCL